MVVLARSMARKKLSIASERALRSRSKLTQQLNQRQVHDVKISLGTKHIKNLNYYPTSIPRVTEQRTEPSCYK